MDYQRLNTSHLLLTDLVPRVNNDNVFNVNVGYDVRICLLSRGKRTDAAGKIYRWGTLTPCRIGGK